MNVTVFDGRVWGWQYREKMKLNVTVFVVRVWGGQYGEKMKLNVTVFVVRAWGHILRGTDNEFYSVFLTLCRMYI